MPQNVAITHRLHVWQEAFGKRWVGVTALIFALVSNADTVAGWLGLESRFGFTALSSKLAPKTWVVLGLLLTVWVLLESVYQVAVERDAARVQLKTEKRNQELSDKMSDHHEFAVHELLNKPPTNFLELEPWQKREKEWRARVIQDMHQSPCSKQERRHVETLGLVTPFVQAATPAITHELNMLITRMARIADIAGKYGE